MDWRTLLKGMIFNCGLLAIMIASLIKTLKYDTCKLLVRLENVR